MTRPIDGPSSGAAWDPYEPDAGQPWDLRRVVHLHRRAGFAATWDELQRDLADGPGPGVDRLLAGKSREYGVAEGFDRTSTLLADAAVASNDPNRLKAWWFYRILFGPDPLGERLTLMWHNHFATGNRKVDDLGLMRRQNESLREQARAPFGDLLGAMVEDPALLVWLDSPSNRKGRPNENLARELMELFTLGVGHYSEVDVREAARALTGWDVEDGGATFVAPRHDDGEKSVLGRSGRLGADDMVSLLREHPATADRLAWRLCDTFMGEGAVDEAAAGALAEDLRAHDLDIGRAVALILRSWAFFDEANLGTRVVDPVPFVAAPVRALELLDPPPSTLVLADWAARLGQELFDPPNVGGWPGGRSWLGGRAVIGRANFAAALVEGVGIGRSMPFDALALADRHGRSGGPEALIGLVAELLLGAIPGGGWLDRLASVAGASASWGPETARRAVALVLACPEAQIC
ncbi:DUF1800 domain-containing protein [Tautonia plasticadhaerens]|uniref:DUF1800 domain-containing protein n=1 Tax=Tautonia plasticadhaerens TaxID=2527974 RepID=A0A518HEC8_9BACT|nr:DUF1800 domain-containing protein [Tautonia plasticadhaerens]QDV39197.1 hypothetical protein ElP_71610 [Tautonia plasticadhaerens]